MGWRGAVSALAGRTLRALPLPVWERALPRRALALCYHLVSDAAVPHVRSLFAYKTSGAFAADVRGLRRRYDLVTDGGLVARLQGRGGRRPALAITFDDGLAECHSIVRPILNRAGARGVFFLTTGCLDNRAMLYRHRAALCVERIRGAGPRESAPLLHGIAAGIGVPLGGPEDLVRLVLRLRSDRTALLDEICGRLGLDVPRYLATRAPYLTRAQAKEMADEGHVLGAHSVTHRDFQLLSGGEIEAEIVESCDAIASITGRTPVPFAVPFSLEGLDRALLLRIRRAHPQVGWIFGTAGFLLEPPGLLNRVVADSPLGSVGGASNLPRLLRAAYAESAWRALGRMRGQGTGDAAGASGA